MDSKQHVTFVEASSIVPFLGVLVAAVLVVLGRVTALDIGLFVGMYAIVMLGLSVGFHRMLAHRSFVTPKWVRIALTAAGSMGAQGPSIVWVAHHRRHHRSTDRAGDPHSPYVDLDGNEISGWQGMWHAHMGWLLNSTLSSDHVRYCPDLVREKSQRWMSIHFLWFVAAGIVVPGIIGGLVTRSFVGFLTGMLWGGLVRIFFVNQITYLINSAGHVVGRRDKATPDESRNLASLALFSFGESWHNNHHFVPRSARFGLEWWQVDLGSMFISGLKSVGLAKSVVRFDHDVLEQRAADLARSGGGRRAAASPQVPMAESRGVARSVSRLSVMEVD
jgi:stearoyl-CoA desaturase (Delta-9 desaturase)